MTGAGWTQTARQTRRERAALGKQQVVRQEFTEGQGGGQAALHAPAHSAVLNTSQIQWLRVVAMTVAIWKRTGWLPTASRAAMDWRQEMRQVAMAGLDGGLAARHERGFLITELRFWR